MNEDEFEKVIDLYVDGLEPKILLDPGDKYFLWTLLAVKYNFPYNSFSVFFEKRKENLPFKSILEICFFYFSSKDEFSFRNKTRHIISNENIEALIFFVFLTGVKLEHFYEWIK